MHSVLDSRSLVAARGTPETVNSVALCRRSGRPGQLPWSPTQQGGQSWAGFQLMQKAAGCRKQRLVLGEPQKPRPRRDFESQLSNHLKHMLCCFSTTLPSS